MPDHNHEDGICFCYELGKIWGLMHALELINTKGGVEGMLAAKKEAQELAHPRG